MGRAASCGDQHAAQSLPPVLQVSVQQQAAQLDMIDMSSPRASLTAAGSLGLHIPQDQQQQQHEGGDVNAWDPFGLAGTASQQQQGAKSSSYPQQQEQDYSTLHLHQQQQQQRGESQRHQQGLESPLASSTAEAVRQQLQDLSFTQIRSPEPGQQGQQHNTPADDEWGDFLSPHS